MSHTLLQWVSRERKPPMAVAVRKADATKVLNAVKAAFRPWIDDDATGPTLVKNWSWTGISAAPYAILWEEGPYEWTHLFPFGGIEEEFGSRIKSVEGRVPESVFVEPITSWAIGVYEGW